MKNFLLSQVRWSYWPWGDRWSIYSYTFCGMTMGIISVLFATVHSFLCIYWNNSIGKWGSACWYVHRKRIGCFGWWVSSFNWHEWCCGVLSVLNPFPAIFSCSWNIGNVHLDWYWCHHSAKRPHGQNGSIIRCALQSGALVNCVIEWTNNRLHHWSLFMADWLPYLVVQAIINLLYFCGMSGFVKDTFLQRYFSQVMKCQTTYIFSVSRHRDCTHC
jgi:hypothetical protein